MNIAANMLGLGNAATPLGLRAMTELQKLNPIPGTATNAMCNFFDGEHRFHPAHSSDCHRHSRCSRGQKPDGDCGHGAAGHHRFTIHRANRRQNFGKASDLSSESRRHGRSGKAHARRQPKPWRIRGHSPPPLSIWGRMLLFYFWRSSYVYLQSWRGRSKAALPMEGPFTHVIKAISLLAIPFFLSFFPLYAALRRIKVYEEFVEGAKEGFGVAIRIIPYLVAILAAVGMFRGAHGIELMARVLKPSLNTSGSRRNCCRWP